MKKQSDIDSGGPRYDEVWVTEVGAWFSGDRVVMHGKDLLSTMAGKSWSELALFAITGQVPDQQQARYLDALAALIGCYPDPRLWNNRVAALAGVARSTSAMAVGASTAVTDALIYGFQPMCGAFRMFSDISARVNDGGSLENILAQRLKNKPSTGRPGKGKLRDIALFPGYGRPTNGGDERVQPLLDIASKYGYANEQAVSIALKVEDWLSERGYGLKLNSGGLIAALCVDQNFTIKHFYLYITHNFNIGFLACNADALDHREGRLFPIRCDQIEYSGVSRRKWRVD